MFSWEGYSSFSHNGKMALLLILILILVVIFAILPYILPGLSKKVVHVIVPTSEHESQHAAQIKDLQQQLQTINMTDEFAKYAKTERKIIKLKDELKTMSGSRKDVFLKMKLGLNGAYHVVQLVCFLGVIYTYRYTPVLELPADWLTPLNKVVSFPTGIPGVVSVTFWLVVCRTIVGRAIAALRSR